mmetsp:Transcript_69612/g.154053  ORF Transcript_69612/g.154053 Transcript_69612/m.154053 type:complete len:571 (-) Transcript_69612:12-1724(-)
MVYSPLLSAAAFFFARLTLGTTSEVGEATADLAFEEFLVDAISAEDCHGAQCTRSGDSPSVSLLQTSAILLPQQSRRTGGDAGLAEVVGSHTVAAPLTLLQTGSAQGSEDSVGIGAAASNASANAETVKPRDGALALAAVVAAPTSAPNASVDNTVLPLNGTAPTAAVAVPRAAAIAAPPAPIAEARHGGVRGGGTSTATSEEVRARLLGPWGLAAAGLLATVFMALLALFAWHCLAEGRRRLATPGSSSTATKVRRQVEALRTCPAAEVERLLPVAGGYDCALSRPLSSQRPVRLEAIVHGPLPGSRAITTPLTQLPCVHYGASVSQLANGGALPVPVAFASESIGFTVSLMDAPHMLVEVQGEEVWLFDMEGGRFTGTSLFGAAPEHWQDFTLFHRTSTGGEGWLHRRESSNLEFQECALLVGARITLMGELLRDAGGALSLQPWQQADASALDPAKKRRSPPREPWRTSWEHGKSGRVLASDDPALLCSSSPSATFAAATDLKNNCDAAPAHGFQAWRDALGALGDAGAIGRVLQAALAATAVAGPAPGARCWRRFRPREELLPVHS